jgi:exopolyphosphatase/guanosine-5'-triphosphate,3'-diphosphate pyrophosphatase
MSNAAKIMKIVLKDTKSKNIVVCGTSVREGVVLQNLSIRNIKHDPLIATCEEIAKQSERFFGLATSLENLLKPMISIGHKEEIHRLLKASCLMADIAWNEHTSSRGIIAAEKILLLPTNSLTHRERAWLAKTLFHRYNRPIDLVKFPFKVSKILSKEDNYTSLVIGLSLRFAMAACAGLPDLIKNLKLELDDNFLKISFLGNTKTLLVDHVYEKLNLLAASLERELVIELL